MRVLGNSGTILFTSIVSHWTVLLAITQGKLPEEFWTSSNIHFREYVGGKVLRSLTSLTNGTQPLWKAYSWSKGYAEGIEMSQQTEDWRRAMQGTPPQGQPKM